MSHPREVFGKGSPIPAGHTAPKEAKQIMRQFSRLSAREAQILTPSPLNEVTAEAMPLLKSIKSLVRENPATSREMILRTGTGNNHNLYAATIKSDLCTVRELVTKDLDTVVMKRPIKGGVEFLKHILNECPKCRVTLRSKWLSLAFDQD